MLKEDVPIFNFDNLKSSLAEEELEDELTGGEFTPEELKKLKVEGRQEKEETEDNFNKDNSSIKENKKLEEF